MNILPILLVLQWQVFFSPKGGTQDAIIRSIDSAKTQVLVQAFDFTSDPIAQALKRAKEKGVKVMVIMEDTKRDKAESKYKFFTRNSIPVKLDKQNVYAHSKIIIIDSTRVITGSFNFSKAAETSNAENTLVLDDKVLARHYLDNWYDRYNYVPPKKKKK